MSAGIEDACVGKRRFHSKRHAKAARAQVRNTGHLNIYVCQFCNFYHLGHIPAVVRRGEVDKTQWRSA